MNEERRLKLQQSEENEQMIEQLRKDIQGEKELIDQLKSSAQLAQDQQQGDLDQQ